MPQEQNKEDPVTIQIETANLAEKEPVSNSEKAEKPAEEAQVSIHDKMQIEIQKQVDLKHKEMLESQAKARELNNIPLKENKELLDRVQEQQRLLKEQQ